MVQRMTGYWWLKSQNKYRNESIYFYSHRHYYRTYRAVYQYSTHKRFEMNKTFIIFVMMILFLAIASYATLPRGIRNKNPGNIKRNNTQWQGMQLIQNDPEFVQFKHPKYGFRAMARILRYLSKPRFKYDQANHKPLCAQLRKRYASVYRLYSQATQYQSRSNDQT